MNSVRQRRGAEESKSLILDAVERLMRKDGYSAVNTRSVAMEAGVKPTLVHYHFETTENLLLEAYRRLAARSEALLKEVLQSNRPLHAMWAYNSDKERTALATQFIALASEREEISAEMGGNVTRFRMLQAAVIEKAMVAAPPGLSLQPEAAAMLLAALGRALVMDDSIGVTAGHADVRALVEMLLERLEPTASGGARSYESPAKQA